MKEIRQITGVVEPTEDEGYENDNNGNGAAMDLDNFDSEPGYYQQVIKPMLAPGHESELLYWLRNIGLIPQSQICKNAGTDSCCNKPMTWIPARVQDSYQWRCPNCREKRTVRDNSVFCEVKCTFKNAIRILLGWCKSKDIETMANILGLKKTVVNVLYNIVFKTADSYIKTHLRDWKIGGPGIIVIVDTYPEGCTISRPLKNSKPILCCAEVKEIPPRYWFEALDRYSRNNKEQVKQLKVKILNSIRTIVHPGSILVANSHSTLCSYDDLQSLRDLYPIIVTVDGLAKHDNADQSIVNNLETIWKLALDICEEAQFYNVHQVQGFLTSQLWRRRFGSEGFEMLINRLVEG